MPKSHQLLLEFEDDSCMCCTVQLWGSMLCVPYSDDLPRRHQGPTPLTDAFDEAYFDQLWCREKSSLSIKALLVTQKRIPGLGNGVLQDTTGSGIRSGSKAYKNLTGEGRRYGRYNNKI